MPKFVYNSLFQFGKDDTKYDLVSKEGISERNFGDKKLLLIEPQVISQLTERAFADVSHLLRSSHLKQLSLILKDNERKIFYFPIGLMGISIILEKDFRRRLDRKNIFKKIKSFQKNK